MERLQTLLDWHKFQRGAIFRVRRQQRAYAAVHGREFPVVSYCQVEQKSIRHLLVGDEARPDLGQNLPQGLILTPEDVLGTRRIGFEESSQPPDSPTDAGT